MGVQTIDNSILAFVLAVVVLHLPVDDNLTKSSYVALRAWRALTGSRKMPPLYSSPDNHAFGSVHPPVPPEQIRETK